MSGDSINGGFFPYPYGEKCIPLEEIAALMTLDLTQEVLSHLTSDPFEDPNKEAIQSTYYS